MMIESIKILFDEQFQNYMESITKLSFDSANKRSLCKYDSKFFNFDQISIDSYRHKNIPSTVDMLAFGKHHVLFVEFKTGRNVKKEKHNLQFKILESILLFENIISKELNPASSLLKQIRKIYIVVYDQIELPRSRTEKIITHLETRQIRFGLDKYKGIFLDETYTLECDEFREVLKKYGILV